jgi:hypothetical protein
VETHTRDEITATHAHKSREEHRRQCSRVTAQTLAQISNYQPKSVVVVSRCCRMFNGCLVYCSMRLKVPFIALKVSGAVGAPFERPWLPSVRGCTGLSGTHQTLHNAMTTNHLIGWFPILGAPDSPVHVTVVLQPTWPLAVG